MDKHIPNIVAIVFGASVLLGVIAALWPDPGLEQAARKNEEIAEMVQRYQKNNDAMDTCLKRSDELWRQGKQKEATEMRCE